MRPWPVGAVCARSIAIGPAGAPVAPGSESGEGAGGLSRWQPTATASADVNANAAFGRLTSPSLGERCVEDDGAEELRPTDLFHSARPCDDARLSDEDAEQRGIDILRHRNGGGVLG